MASSAANQQQSQGPELDRYVVIHVATTCDEHGVYVTKDSAEVIEIGWILLDAKTCDELYRESVLVKPVNTPITPLCTSLTTLTWEHVRNSGSFRDAVNAFDTFAQQHLTADNLEFAFVTLDCWDLRVQLPREARDKAVVLPPYLQHSRTFDLRTEYQRWQTHHPESLPFGSSSLSNICAALEVEPVQASAPIKHNLPFHLQALAPASPRRAMEEAVTLARVLRGLIRKSQPQSEHPDVLTRPMDARADVRAFLGERSKVLHMSGLPHDTTQSELESWFTQFGGRPIAFWTLRTPDQHKPTGSGFAVFSSHEEAAESLCMNGRALNEKAIEVSPSSSRVLDRAAEILTPFPPSKNRPRPGDWTCPSCGFSNFQRRTACFRCSYPAMPQGPADPSMMSYGYPGAVGYGGPMGMGGMGHPPHMGHGHMGGGGGGSHSGGGRGSGGIVPFRPGDWKCANEQCNYHNFAKNPHCLRCGGPRTGSHVDPSPYPSAAMVGGVGVGMSDGSGSNSYALGPPSMAGTPGPASFATPAGFGSGAFGPPGGFGGPAGPSSYGMPGLGGPYGAGPMGMSAGYGPNGGMPAPPAGFDARAEAAFSGAGGAQATAGAAAFGNGAGGFGGSDPAAAQQGQASAGGQQGQGQGGDINLSFLSSGFGALSMSDERGGRGPGGAGQTKSPA